MLYTKIKHPDRLDQVLYLNLDLMPVRKTTVQELKVYAVIESSPFYDILVQPIISNSKILEYVYITATGV